MPPGHQQVLALVEARPSLREMAAAGSADLREVYDACVGWLGAFRALHLDYAGRYTHFQAQASAANPSDVGTGRTPFMRYLAQHRNETAERKLGD